MKLILVVCYISAAFSASAKKCTPEKFECEMVGKVGIVGPNPAVLSVIGKTSFDNSKGLIVFDEQLTYQSQQAGELTFNLTIYNFFNANVAFVYREDLKACFKASVPILHELIYCPGDKGTKIVKSFLLDGKIADVVEISDPPITAQTTLFRDSMLPISTVSIQTVNNVTSMNSMQYGNAIIGISDESIFNVPSLCYKAVKDGMRHHAFWHNAI